tara:strand:+ start:119 stop:244 length:126 start_codon:yes stop_codon:yes gene_type:complete
MKAFNGFKYNIKFDISVFNSCGIDYLFNILIETVNKNKEFN